ncbi:hypothetical protein [Lactovum odontotermitis]
MKLKFGFGLAIPLMLLSLSACSNNASKNSSSSSSAEKISQSQKKDQISKSFQKVVADTKESLKGTEETLADTYSGIQVRGEAPETLVLTYTYKEKTSKTLSDTVMAHTLAASLSSDFDKYGEDFPDFKERFIYLNPDHSTLYDITITADDVKEAEEASQTSESSSAAQSTEVSATFEVFVNGIRAGTESMKDLYSDIQVEAVPPETVLITLTYPTAVSGLAEDAVTSAFATSLGSQFSAAKTLFPNFAMRIVLLNPDKSVVYDHTLTIAEVEAANAG